MLIITKNTDCKSKLEIMYAKLAFAEQLLDTAEKLNDSDAADFVAAALDIVKGLALGICSGQKKLAIRELREIMEKAKDEIQKIKEETKCD